MPKIGKIFLAALVAGAVTLPPDVAVAQQRDRHDAQQERSDQGRPKRREWRKYDYNRVEPGQRRYDAARYYNRGTRERRLGRNDRIYRGSDDRYYCRRSDGTTGLIVGGIAGGVLGNLIAPEDSKTLGTILGASGGAAVGRAVDRNNVTCR